MNHQIIKGVDDEIEFKGFRGRYFYQLAGFSIGLICITFLLYGIGFTSIWLFIFMIGMALVGFFYIQGKQERNKKYGHIYGAHTPPRSIIQKRSFHNFIK